VRVDLHERAAVLEHDQGLSRVEAEARAIAEVLDGLADQVPDGILGELIEADRRRRDPELAGAVVNLGLHGPLMYGFGFAVAEGDTWRPAQVDEQGKAAVIVPAIRDGRLVDLVAQSLSSGRMLSRFGVATILGADQVAPALGRGALYIFKDAVQWLRGGALGVVVLDWRRVGEELDGVPRLLCSAEIATKLYNATRGCFPRPIIATPEPELAHAS
jgi:hypothetical protein